MNFVSGGRPVAKASIPRAAVTRMTAWTTPRWWPAALWIFAAAVWVVPTALGASSMFDKRPWLAAAPAAFVLYAAWILWRRPYQHVRLDTEESSTQLQVDAPRFGRAAFVRALRDAVGLE